MNKTLAIIGSGDLGQQIAHIAINDGHFEQVVFIDDFSEEEVINNIQVIGKTDDTVELYKHNKFDQLIIGIGYKHLEKKKELFDFFKQKIPFATIIHSSVWLDKTVIVNEGSIIYPNCTLDINVVIEKNTLINLSTTIAHDSVVGAHSFVSPCVAIAGFVKIEELCVIGINSTIIDNVSIKQGTHIGGGTVVTKDVTKEGLYVGNPQRFIK